MEFFEIWTSFRNPDDFNQLCEEILHKIGCINASSTVILTIRDNISKIVSRMRDRWNKCSRQKEYFLKRYLDWLQEENFILFEGVFDANIAIPSTSCSSGRKMKSFEDASFKTKKRRVSTLVEENSTIKLTFATEVALRAEGKRSAASLVSNASSITKELKYLREKKTQQRSMTPEEALALFIDTKSTVHAYKLNRKKALSIGHKMHPSYHEVQRAKNNCLPPANSIILTETSAEIPLQIGLDLWTSRLLNSNTIIFNDQDNLELFCKWGCDGSAGHSTYKQKYTVTEGNDHFLFLISFVPIKISNETHSVWENPSPGSTRYCRPHKFLFEKESDILIKSEIDNFQNQIYNLNPTKLVIDGKEVTIKYKFFLTMIDGKVCNVITDTSSSMTCYICGATPKFLNNEPKEENINTENYLFGLSTLHLWIRTFECLLHISYRLNIKKWQIRKKVDKVDFKDRKLLIQGRFKKEMGLIVDQPKQGFGTSNDGNTARRFFKFFEKTSDITGVDRTLIKNLGILLRTLSCGRKINIKKFSKFCSATKDLYLKLYSWYYMPVSIHKLFYHAKDIIKSFSVPIGQMTEETQEARHKDCRRFREKNARKTSRSDTNFDLLSMLLIKSDPLINSFRTIPKKK